MSKHILKICDEKLTQEENNLLDDYIFRMIHKEREKWLKDYIEKVKEEIDALETDNIKHMHMNNVKTVLDEVNESLI